jgi:plasmid segregation protein ParM
MSHQPVVRAIDVGYGTTKYTIEQSENGAPIVCSYFPSLAPLTQGSSKLSSRSPPCRDIVIVDVAGQSYDIGLDARVPIGTDAQHGRSLDYDFAATNPYLALIEGALANMNQPEIDVLVLGLPVNVFERLAPTLEERIVGTHMVPMHKDVASQHIGIPVLVKSVIVLLQPVGGYYHYARSTNNYDKMKSQINLVIDIGYFSLDWILSFGGKALAAWSGSHPGGMYAVQRSIADAMTTKLEQLRGDLSTLDDALSSGTEPYLNLKACGACSCVEFDHYVQSGRVKALEFVDILCHKVGSQAATIQNIILVGGGATFFQPFVSSKFPQHDVVVASDPIFANVRGFQLVGEEEVASTATPRDALGR